MWSLIVSVTDHAIFSDLPLCRVGVAFLVKLDKSQETRKDVWHPDKTDYNAYQIHADNYGHHTNRTAVKITQSFSPIKSVAGDEKIVCDGTNSRGRFLVKQSIHVMQLQSCIPEIAGQ